MIIAVSDVHLGYKFSDVPQFVSFLDDVALNEEVDHFVLMGDIFDMWRRDPVKLFFEYEDIIREKFRYERGKRPEVHYIVGNHDYHMLELKESFWRHFNVDISADLFLKEGDEEYYFMHGHQYEYHSILELYHEFADKLSLGDDEIGMQADSLWNMYIAMKPILKMAFYTFLGVVPKLIPLIVKTPIPLHVLDLKSALKPPEERLPKDYRKDIEYIENVVQKDEKMADKFIVYGHTHLPHCDINNRHANAGSWVDDPNRPDVEKNTYVKIEGEKVDLLPYPP